MQIVRLDSPSLLQLWLTYKFHIRTLAILSEVPESVVNDMLAFIPVSRKDAMKVLIHLSKIIHRECTLETVHIPLKRWKGFAS